MPKQGTLDSRTQKDPRMIKSTDLRMEMLDFPALDCLRVSRFMRVAAKSQPMRDRGGLTHHHPRDLLLQHRGEFCIIAAVNSVSSR